MVFRKKTKKAPETFHFEERGPATGWGEAMRNLCEDIANSFDARVVRVKQKATDLKRFLSNAEASRMRDFWAMHQGIRARQQERNGEVAGMLGGFRRECEAAASHWRNMAATTAKRRASATR